MTTTTYAGSHYSTTTAAASAWAHDALPDVSVLDAGEDASAAAEEITAHWEREAASIGQEIELPRAECVAALVRRIEAHRAR
jgi:hypothetical protein